MISDNIQLYIRIYFHSIELKQQIPVECFAFFKIFSLEMFVDRGELIFRFWALLLVSASFFFSVSAKFSSLDTEQNIHKIKSVN